MAVFDRDNTKARLLEAAGEEFAAKGYDSASIRKICDRVGANCAAVHYHFGSKEQLYVEAVLEAHRCGTEMLSDSIFDQETPGDQLRCFIRHFLSKVVAIDDGHKWHQTLMLREMLEPTNASEVLVREAIRPRFERLVGILAAICPAADAIRLNALAFSVIGQCLHYKFSREISARLVGAEAFSALDLDYLSDHITTFCLAALGVLPPLNRAGESSSPSVVAVH